MYRQQQNWEKKINGDNDKTNTNYSYAYYMNDTTIIKSIMKHIKIDNFN